MTCVVPIFLSERQRERKHEKLSTTWCVSLRCKILNVHFFDVSWFFNVARRSFFLLLPTSHWKCKHTKAELLKVNGKLRMLLLMKNILNGETNFHFLLFCSVNKRDALANNTHTLIPPTTTAEQSSHQRWNEVLANKKMFASKLQTEKFNISQRKGALNWWQPPSCHNRTRSRLTHTLTHWQNHKPENSFSSSLCAKQPQHWHGCMVIRECGSQPLSGSAVALTISFSQTFFSKFNFKTFFH